MCIVFARLVNKSTVVGFLLSALLHAKVNMMEMMALEQKTRGNIS